MVLTLGGAGLPVCDGGGVSDKGVESPSRSDDGSTPSDGSESQRNYPSLREKILVKMQGVASVPSPATSVWVTRIAPPSGWVAEYVMSQSVGVSVDVTDMAGLWMRVLF